MKFTDGYSNLSYLNITKQFCNELYKNANNKSKLSFFMIVIQLLMLTHIPKELMITCACTLELY